MGSNLNVICAIFVDKVIDMTVNIKNSILLNNREIAYISI